MVATIYDDVEWAGRWIIVSSVGRVFSHLLGHHNRSALRPISIGSNRGLHPDCSAQRLRTLRRSHEFQLTAVPNIVACPHWLNSETAG